VSDRQNRSIDDHAREVHHSGARCVHGLTIARVLGTDVDASMAC
jgi:hypothetical protein